VISPSTRETVATPIDGARGPRARAIAAVENRPRGASNRTNIDAMNRPLACLVVLFVLSTSCKKKRFDPMDECAAGDLQKCAAMCATQPYPMCRVAAESDHANAEAYLVKGCDAKDAQACEMLVVRYTSAATANPDKAKAYADKACALDEQISCDQAKKLLRGAP